MCTAAIREQTRKKRLRREWDASQERKGGWSRGTMCTRNRAASPDLRRLKTLGEISSGEWKMDSITEKFENQKKDFRRKGWL